MLPTQANAFVNLQQIAGGYCLSRSLHVVAELGVADALDETPRSAADLAAAVGAHPAALSRTLRLLAAHGVFEAAAAGQTNPGDEASPADGAEGAGGADGTQAAFRHTPASRLLRTDHPQSMRAFARMFGLRIIWETFGVMEHSVRTGSPAAVEVYPDGLWAYLAERPDEARTFNAAMAAKAQGAIGEILASYDFSRFDRIADVGGGRGHLLRAILDEAAPSAEGVLFELQHVIEEAKEVASERLALQAGDFFRDALPASDLYLLMEILHDWGDEESLAILRAIRRAAPAGARLLVIETIVPEGPGPDWSKMLDIHMLTLLGGLQRTRQEYEALLAEAGFTLEQEVETRAGISILEARASSKGLSDRSRSETSL